ncbi:MAG: YHYH protein [Bacteroidota bacterium]
MKRNNLKNALLILMLLPLLGYSQAIINIWKLNVNGQKASYWVPSGNPPSVTYSYVVTTDSASVLKVCYRTDSVWIYSHGMVFNMGKYSNPGACSTQVYKYRFPRTQTVQTSKTISPKVGAIGCLVNGIPMYGLGDSKSWNGTTNTNMGSGIWNVEVYMGEGVSLDTALSAHPQQGGAYHSHAKPRRLYQNTPTTQHSPIIGYAFDGYPVYGPYGYGTPTNSASTVSRMKSGYSLRSITTRTALPYGVTASQTGPPVNSTYPIGTYCEDYEWLSSNNGDLDKYNGRTCVTPEYPAGTYAYFVTIDVAGTPQFPYYIGIEYYGKPDASNFASGANTSSSVKFPSSGTTCNLPTNLDEVIKTYSLKVFPNPSNGEFLINIEENLELFAEAQVVNMIGEVVYSTGVTSETTLINLPTNIGSGIYFVRILGKQSQVYATEKIMVN